jgi:hypothetical protein
MSPPPPHTDAVRADKTVKKTAKKNLESILVFPFLYEFEPITGLKQERNMVYKTMSGIHLLSPKFFKKTISVVYINYCPVGVNSAHKDG